MRQSVSAAYSEWNDNGGRTKRAAQHRLHRTAASPLSNGTRFAKFRAKMSLSSCHHTAAVEPNRLARYGQAGMTPKKKAERRVIAQLQALWPDVPSGELIEGERPDFSVATPDGLVGLEVTRFHRPREKGRALPAEQEELAWRTCRLLESSLSEVPPVHAHLHFNDLYPLNKTLIPQLVAHLSATIASHLCQHPILSCDRIGHDNSELPHEVAFLHLTVVPGSTRTRCLPIGATFVPTLQPADIQAIINSKREKVVAYRQRCHCLVLAIEIHGFRLASIASLDSAVLSHRFDSPFDYAFVLIDGDTLVELQRA